jgi:bacillithiol biosynthesis cysteine-adding enzyme BshC
LDLEDRLNFELLIGRPSGSPLFEEYLRGGEAAASFYSGSWRDPSAYRALLESVDTRFDLDARRSALGALRIPEGVDQARLDRWLEAGGAVVTTGQQPGLLGGPLYSLYKGISAIRLAERLEDLLGRPVLPVFWVASEDHDWDEADHTYVIDTTNELVRLQVQDPGHGHRALHRIPLGDEIAAVVEQAIENLPETDFSGPYFDQLRDAYKPGGTLADGFTEVLWNLLAPLGMCFADAASPAIKELSRPVLLEELEHSLVHETLLREDANKLDSSGFAPQVPILDGAVNLFLEGPDGRDRIYRRGDAFELCRSRESVSTKSVRERVESDPLSLSPNVLLRPVVESTIFPVLSYVGGPGEAAYYAQLKRLFEAHGLMMPVIYPRHAVTVIEAKIRKRLDKFSLDVESLNRPLHEIMSDIAQEEVPDDVRRALGELKGAVARGSADLLKAATTIDPTLKGPVTNARNSALAAFQAAERKIVQSVKREQEVASNQLEVAQRHLFPDGQPQERMLAPLYYLVRYGSDFVESLVKGFAVDLAEETE